MLLSHTVLPIAFLFAGFGLTTRITLRNNNKHDKCKRSEVNIHEAPRQTMQPTNLRSHYSSHRRVALLCGSGWGIQANGTGSRCSEHDPATLTLRATMSAGQPRILAAFRLILRYLYEYQGQKQTPWPLVRKRTIPTERPPLGEI
jgi:hypothetical protein